MELKGWQMEYNGINRKVAQSLTHSFSEFTWRYLAQNFVELCGKNYQLKNIGIDA